MLINPLAKIFSSQGRVKDFKDRGKQTIVNVIIMTALWILLLYVCLWPSARSLKHKCISVIKPNLDLCASGEFPVFPEGSCVNDIHICKRGFNITFVRLEPLSHERFTTLIKQMFYHCCGSCVRTTIVNNFTDVTAITPSSISSSHIIYPILGCMDAKSLFGYNFIPLWDAPGAYYITKERTKAMVIRRLVLSCGNLWPLLVIMLLMALIAGFIIWLIETWINKEMFPRTFLIGLLDGFWWSFISMTTVGYGDKIPLYPASRLFSVFWILTGITICSMFTASLTTEITSAIAPEVPDMAKKTVGVLKQHMYDAALVTRHRGIITESKGLGLMTDVIELTTKLKRKEINGFLLDKFGYIHASRYFHSVNKFAEIGQFFLKETLLTEKTYGGDKLSFGILVKENEDYVFLKDFVMDNRLYFEICANIRFNVIGDPKEDTEHDVFAPENGFFIPSLIGTGATVLIIFTFGLIYEITRKKFKTIRERVNICDVGLGISK